MKYISTRKGLPATSAESVFRGLAPDGGLYVPVIGNGGTGNGEWILSCATLREAEEAVLARLFDDIPAEVRTAAVDRLRIIIDGLLDFFSFVAGQIG